MAETQENIVTSQSGPNPHIKYHLQQKTKRDVVGKGLELQKGGRQFTGRWSCCVPCPVEIMVLGEIWEKKDTGSVCSH